MNYKEASIWEQEHQQWVRKAERRLTYAADDAAGIHIMFRRSDARHAVLERARNSAIITGPRSIRRCFQRLMK